MTKAKPKPKVSLRELQKVCKTREAYDIFTALRGPDESSVNAQYAKILTSAVLRHFLRMLPNGGAQVLSPQIAMNVPQWEIDGAQKFLQLNAHFQSHVLRAFEALSKISRPAKAYYAWLVAQRLF
ncbi:MAG: hypothetical protein ACREYE_16225 [Gammaproteobacteria bacterium]